MIILLTFSFFTIILPYFISTSNVAFSWIINNTASLEGQKIQVAASDNNIYMVWSTDNNTTNSNGELMFRSSSDGGQTFGDKINLSNTNSSDSINAEIETFGNERVIITWWEKNHTTNIPLAKTSNDNGVTFGPPLELGKNGPIDNRLIDDEELLEGINLENISPFQ